MPYIKQIVNYINNNLKANAFKGALKDAQVNGIAVSAPRGKGDKVEFLPIVFDDHFDDGRYVGIDDVFPVQIYHKNKGIIPGQGTVSNYGDGNKIQKRIANMAMIVFAKRINAGMTPEDLYDLIDANIPEVLDVTTKTSLTGLQTVDIRISSVDFNSLQIIQSEYKLEKVSIAPSDIFFQINYIIECTYRKDCIITCCNS